ncbi:MAG: caspase family protein [Bacteroidales bacterium]|nr:caspase family protein [Bacteroidales bacterium]
MLQRALCVGINKFKYFPNNALQGCVNDANAMEALLMKWLGFEATDITKLTDEQATKSNIMNNLKEMVNGAKKGKYNYLVFSISSHGTQVPDRNRDEDDGADEAYCPYDLRSSGDVWDPAHIIIDDELHDLFASLPNNVLLEVFADTCHSGTSLKSIDLLHDRRPRWMPPPSYTAFEKINGHQSRGLNYTFLEKGIVHHILWAGCRADQTSADANIDNNWHGAFTYYFCQAINETKNQLSRKEVLTIVRNKLKAAHYSQTPQLECEATKRNTSILSSKSFKAVNN